MANKKNIKFDIQKLMDYFGDEEALIEIILNKIDEDEANLILQEIAEENGINLYDEDEELFDADEYWNLYNDEEDC